MKSLVRLLSPTFWMLFFCATLHAQQISLQALVTPSTVITRDGRPITFALHGFIEFRSLSELFPYIDSQAHRWPGSAALDDGSGNNLPVNSFAVASRVALSP